MNNFCGVKKKCVLSEKLTTFNVTSGFPPDIVHDLFEGIVPMEMSLFDCIHFQNIFQFGCKSIKDFPFKWTDKTDRPHPVPLTDASRKTIGGHASRELVFHKVLSTTAWTHGAH